MIFETTPLRGDLLPERPDWVLIAGEGSARIFYRPADSLIFIKELFSSDAVQEEIKTTQTSAVMDTSGRRYKIVKSQSSKQREAALFCRELAAYLDAAREKDFGRLVLVAAPVLLTWIKASLSPKTLKRLLGEAEIDLTQSSGRELEKHVAALFEGQRKSGS
jgi:protein required for attachment to host cells